MEKQAQALRELFGKNSGSEVPSWDKVISTVEGIFTEASESLTSLGLSEDDIHKIVNVVEDLVFAKTRR